MQRFGLNENVIENIINILKKYEEVESARIFGSRARGDYRIASDIDIALYGEKLTHTINTKIYYEIDKLYLPYKIDLVNINTLVDGDKLKENILKEGVEFYVKQFNRKL